MKLIISITAIFALSATLFGADIDFNSSPLGAEEVPGCQGRYDIVEVTEGDHALRVYSDGKEDFGGARIPLLEGKVIEKNFKLFVDCQLTTAHAAGRLVSIGGLECERVAPANRRGRREDDAARDIVPDWKAR